MRRRFGIASPRLACAGLNPHAGEGRQHGPRGDRRDRAGARSAARGRASRSRARSRPTRCSTPKPAPRYDVALTMYHDQGLIPIKTLSFDTGVNVTLGLPFVRTSPDHGTAFVAGRGIGTRKADEPHGGPGTSRPGWPADGRTALAMTGVPDDGLPPLREVVQAPWARTEKIARPELPVRPQPDGQDRPRGRSARRRDRLRGRTRARAD